MTIASSPEDPGHRRYWIRHGRAELIRASGSQAVLQRRGEHVCPAAPTIASAAGVNSPACHRHLAVPPKNRSSISITKLAVEHEQSLALAGASPAAARRRPRAALGLVIGEALDDERLGPGAQFLAQQRLRTRRAAISPAAPTDAAA
jgi:hypothetical protein